MPAIRLPRLGDPSLAVVASLGAAWTASAATIHVPADYPTIQGAVDVAVEGDEVVVAPGTYTGPGNRDIEFMGKAITIRSEDPADPRIVAATIVDCEQAGRGFLFQDGEAQDTVVDGLTITNGLADRGGGIRVTNSSSPTIRRCVIADNTATSFGGGISSDHFFGPDGDLNLVDCTVSGNAPDGICTLSSDAHITGCTITDNAGPGIDASYGEVYVIEGSTIADNQGTGIDLDQPKDVVIGTTTVAGNVDVAGAGGIRLFSNDAVEVRNCMIVDNAGEHGGGIHSTPSFGLIEVTGCTVSGNTATETGGGIRVGASDMVIRNSILSGNHAPEGPELHLSSGFNHPAVVTMDYSVLALGAEGTGVVVQSKVGAESQFIQGVGNLIDISPSFVDADAGDYHLSANSAAVDAGDPAFVAGPDETDIDGDLRVIGGQVDIGADEFRLAGDIDGDGMVGIGDLLLLLAGWGPCAAPPCAADLNGDGMIDIEDLLIILATWGA